MSDAVTSARAAFERGFGAQPEGVAFAPGRVNLIGDHVDYNDGLVLPLPLALGTSVAWRKTAGNELTAIAADFGDERAVFDPATGHSAAPGWKSYVAGMAQLLRDAGVNAGGLELAIAGDLPRGSGLSSSASLCIAIGRALVAAASEGEISAPQLAKIAQQVEHRFAGVACGIMDQMVVACGERGAAMLLDCRTLDWQQVDLPQGWCVLVIQSGVTRELADGAYNTRRQECERGASALGVASLRDIDPAQADFTALPENEARRARHVVGEIERTRRAAEAINAGDIVRLGELLREAHISMRDLFEASHPEVDSQVERLNALIGAEGGARMTGGGFGGAIMAVCQVSAAASVIEQLNSDSIARNGCEATIIRAFN